MATHRWKGQLAKFRGGGVEVNETGRRVGICWGWTSLHPIGPGNWNFRCIDRLNGFSGVCTLSKASPLGLSFASAQETLFQDFSLKREPFLFGKASRRPPVDLVRVFRRSVQGFTKSLPESAPGSFPGGPSYNPYACHGWQGF